MDEVKKVTKPIPDQIFEEMILIVKKHPEFDDDLVKKIEDLYKKGGLKKSANIIKTITPEQEL